MHVNLDYFVLIFLYFPFCLLTTVNDDIKKLNLKPQNTPILVAFHKGNWHRLRPVEGLPGLNADFTVSQVISIK